MGKVCGSTHYFLWARENSIKYEYKWRRQKRSKLVQWTRKNIICFELLAQLHTIVINKWKQENNGQKEALRFYALPDIAQCTAKTLIFSVHYLECLYKINRKVWLTFYAFLGQRGYYFNVAHCYLVICIKNAVEGSAPVPRVYLTLTTDFHSIHLGMVTELYLHSSMCTANYPWTFATKYNTPTEAHHKKDVTDKRGLWFS